MESYELNEVVQELHSICFDEQNGIIRHRNNNEPVSFLKSTNGTGDFPRNEIVGYCDACSEYEKPTDQSKKEKGFKLSAVSHGTHTFDFLEAIGIKNPEAYTEGWETQPVLFLMENPSKDYRIYDYLLSDLNHTGKRPAKNWYWIHGDLRKDKALLETDRFLCMSEYGRMVLSLILRYRLANAYLTNIVKCGMSNAKYTDNPEDNHVLEDEALNTWYYQNGCIVTCMERILKKEIQSLSRFHNEIIVFAFGGRVYQLASDFFRNDALGSCVSLYKLPHPAGQMSNDYRKYVLKGIVAEALGVELQREKAIPAILNKPPRRNRCFEVLRNHFQDVRFEGKHVEMNEGNASKGKLHFMLKPYNSIFTEKKEEQDELVSELILSDNLDQTGVKKIGYMVVENAYWAWDDAKKEPMDPSEFRYYNEFRKCIEDLMSSKD